MPPPCGAKKRLRVNVFVGGPPAMTVAAVMPLPEGVSELAFAGVLGRRRVPMISQRRLAADPRRGRLLHRRPPRSRCGNCPKGRSAITWATTAWRTIFPVMLVERVYHRRDAIWPFTVVGRPPQEDSMFSQLIHELVGPIIPRTIPGVRAVHAVEAAGVHPLLLAIGSERYVPYEERRRPRELLTLANALLGQGQLSLAKYLWIVAGEDNPELDVRDVPRLPAARAGTRRLAARPALPDLHHDRHARLQRRRPERGLEGGHRGGRARRCGRCRWPSTAASTVPEALGFRKPRVFLPGILVVEGRRTQAEDERRRTAPSTASARRYNRRDAINGFPLVVVVDQADFAARNLDNFLWTTFTRSNPAADIYGIEAFLLRQALGLLRLAGDRRPGQAAPRAAAGRRSGK